MRDPLVLCGKCGATNRLFSNVTAQQLCGRCGNPLTIAKGNRKILTGKLAWVLIGGLVVVGYLWADKQTKVRPTALDMTGLTPIDDSVGSQSKLFEIDHGRNLTGSGSELDQSIRAVEPARKNPHIQVPISAGVIQWPKSPGVAPLAINTQPGRDYYVKLVDMAGKTIMTMYVEGGRHFETKVPLGAYEMRYASGKTWYGAIHRFGPETLYAKADSLFDFRFDGSGYSGYTVELILQPNGNLHTTHISATEF